MYATEVLFVDTILNPIEPKAPINPERPSPHAEGLAISYLLYGCFRRYHLQSMPLIYLWRGTATISPDR